MLAQTCQNIRLCVQAHLDEQFGLCIAKWVRKPTEFQAIMLQTHAVVSGSVATAFVLKAGWESNDLDIYVPKGEGKQVLVSYLTGEDTYSVSTSHPSPSGQPPYPGSYHTSYPYQSTGHQSDMLHRNAHSNTDPPMAPSPSPIASVTRLVRHRPKQESGCRIDIVESGDDEATTPVYRFTATFVQNWVGPGGLWLLHPSDTFAQVGRRNPLSLSAPGCQEKWLAKYRGRGFIIEPGDETDSERGLRAMHFGFGGHIGQ